MAGQIRAVVEYNEKGYLLHAESFPGAYARGKTLEEAARKIRAEVNSYLQWAGTGIPYAQWAVDIVQEMKSGLDICDADSDVIFDSEKCSLSRQEYAAQKELVIKSAECFYQLYASVPDKNFTSLPPRKTFYGQVPRTAEEMIGHTNQVTSYYAGEIGVAMENHADIRRNRFLALERIEQLPDYLSNRVFDGSYGEQWSLRKVLRRFLWHDRIHAKAMYRMAVSVWGKESIANPFFFSL